MEQTPVLLLLPHVRKKFQGPGLPETKKKTHLLNLTKNAQVDLERNAPMESSMTEWGDRDLRI